MGHIHFKKLTKCQKFIEIFHYCLTRLRNKKQGFFWLYLLIRTTLRKENTRQHNFKKHFKFCNFDEIFFCGMNRLKNTNSSVFIQCQHIRTILRNRVCLKNIQNFKILMKHFTVQWTDLETQIWMFLYNISTQEPL